MNAPEYWWVLSMSAACLYGLFARVDYQHSMLFKPRLIQAWPHALKLAIHCLCVPVLLAICVLSLSDWLTEQSFALWLLTLEEYGKLIGILLSLQAVYFILHNSLVGSVALLVVSTLTLQLWLYYQALGIDFQTLAQVYAAAIFVVLAFINFLLHAIDQQIRDAIASPLACLVLVSQWIFSTSVIAPDSVIGFDWITLNTTLIPIGFMLLLVISGYMGQLWFSRYSKTARIVK